jgi:Family of unknown function (DUF6459)
VPPRESPALRLVEIPDAAPPYDCETHRSGCTAAGEAALASPGAENPGAENPGAADSPGVPSALGVPPAPGADRAGRAQPGARPDAVGTTAAWPRQFAQVMVEILAGVRPPGQIVPWTTDRVRRKIRQLSPLLVSDQRPRIQRIVVSRPVVSVMEMTVVVSVGPRSRALALRFDYVRARPAAPGLPTRPARWVCTTIEAG